MSIKKVAIVGAGLIGSGWASLFAQHKLETVLYANHEETLKKGLAKARSYLDVQYSQGLISEDPAKLMEYIKPSTTMEDVIRGTDYVQESIIEDYRAKKELYRELDSRLPHNVIIGSSTSGLLMTEIQKAMKQHPERAVIVHPWNPPHLLPLVEIVPGERTSEETVKAAKEFMDSLKRVTVVLKKEVPGFLGNRLAFALFREAVDLVDQGVASVEDIDKAMTAAIGLRWAFMGPFLTYHLGGGEGGIEYFFNRGFGYGANEWMNTLAKWDKFPYTAVKKVVEQMKEYQKIKGRNFAELSRWRDEMLIDIVKLISSRENQKKA